MSTIPGNSVNEFRTRLDIFVKESRRRQTDHAKNLLTGEKTHSMKEEREFADFVFKNGYWDDLMDFDVIQKIARAIMSAKIQFPATNKIYYSVVWVYYFDCQKQIADCTSLFKVYCDEDDNLAVFIDWQQNKYSSWNEYLSKAHLPESIICVPKNGQYKMDKTGALLLNYLRTKASQKKDVISNYIELLVKKLKDLLWKVWENPNMEIIMRLISSVLKFTKRPSLLFIGKAIEYIQFTNGRIDIENTLKSLRVGELKPLILCIATALNASY